MLTGSDTILKAIEEEGFSLSRRSLQSACGPIEILYIQQLTDRVSLADFVIRPLCNYIGQALEGLKAETVARNVLLADDCKIQDDETEVQSLILDGKVVILLPGDDQYIAVNLKKVEHRSISVPMIEYTLRGPRDAFTENLDTNLSLIRYRNKDEKLRIEQFKIGTRTQTNVAMIYIEDIAGGSVVGLMRQRLGTIDVDSIADSGELQVYLQNSSMSLFPQLGLVERSDMATHLLHEGKVNDTQLQ
jgi:hypothetical protein